jgi:enoyl-CoA hydratase/carnithine racemase
MDYEQIRFEVDDGVATLTLDRPERRNAWSLQMGDEVRHAFAAADERDDVRVLVVTGAGSDFCVGADLKDGGKIFEQARARGAAARTPLRTWQIRKPVIGALRGVCAGVGATLPLHWDIRLAGESLRMAFVFVRRGVVPEAACTWFLPRLVGVSRATELLLSGRMLRAEEACAWGLVSQVLPDDDVLPAAQALARDVAANAAPVALALTKRLLHRQAAVATPEEAEALDAKVFAWTRNSPDGREGMRAFAEKRPPRWTLQVSRDLPDVDDPEGEA